MKFNIRKIFIISILVVCVIAINLAVYFSITQKLEKSEDEIINDTALLEENFNSIFDNGINYQGNDMNVSKEDSTKELIYTNYINQDKIENSYELSVYIPHININNDAAKKINNEIDSIFYNKVTDIIAKTNEYTIYNVQYKAYVNDNIVSLIISATLKEGENAQRVIMKTYNYNLSSNNEIGINEVLQFRKISEEYAQNKINQTIKVASEDANRYNELGYTKYFRNLNDKMYNLENTKTYFIGKNMAVYIIYAYGNLSYTSEFDLLVI